MITISNKHIHSWLESRVAELNLRRKKPKRGATAKKIKKDQKCEFNLDGSEVIPAEYDGMDVQGLLSMSAVEPKCHKMIAKNQFFELHHLHKADGLEFSQQRILTDADESDGCIVTVSSNVSKSQQPKSRPEFFQLLYSLYYNFRECVDDPKCHRDHVCYYCGNPNHKACECLRYHNNKRGS